MPEFDPTMLRSGFPALSATQNGQRVIFFDGPGGTQVPQRVIDAVSSYYRDMNANMGGSFLTSRRNDAMLAGAHLAFADFVNAKSPNAIKFSQNMTTHTFNISRAIAATLQPGDEVVTTVLDHEANVSPWRALHERGVQIHTADIHPEDCTLNMEDLDTKITERTKVVAVGYASNAVGTINDVKSVIDRAHAVGALVYVDAVHYAPHGPIDVQALDCDFLAMSVYKFFGPHVGVLYGKEEILERLPAYKVRPAHDKFEVGTLNHEGIAGSLAALDYLAEVGTLFGARFAERYAGFTGRALKLKQGMEAIRIYERTLLERLVEGINRIPSITAWGLVDPGRLGQRTPTLALTFDRVRPSDVSHYLGDRGIFVWHGDFYAQALVERLGLYDAGGLIRIGLTHYNTAEEVDQLLTALESLVQERVLV